MRWDSHISYKRTHGGYNPIGKITEYDWWVLHLLLSTLYCLFFLHILLLLPGYLTLMSFRKPGILTSNRLYLFYVIVSFRNPLQNIVLPQNFIIESKKISKTSCSSHKSETQVAGSEFRYPQIQSVHCCVIIKHLFFTENYHNLDILNDMEHSLYLQNRDGRDCL